eukprot:CAMPEP_0118640702 /NCGR_PEP_ID=MMETSP0785-20121206/4892_1 /TAXON_ID=91992 /ORGANISM="Bolidomonas pacifica, Strain CCMP 1866" /LENGTH=35 /DNA_ID= /DNA_START= /DNA_END= /DNA_ORIENTATION=
MTTFDCRSLAALSSALILSITPLSALAIRTRQYVR